MIEQLLQPTHILVLALVLIFFFGGRWFAALGNGFRDALLPLLMVYPWLRVDVG
jgi:hypothetical protein